MSRTKYEFYMNLSTRPAPRAPPYESHGNVRSRKVDHIVSLQLCMMHKNITFVARGLGPSGSAHKLRWRRKRGRIGLLRHSADVKGRIE